tara:strand:- start:4582 stop:5943 length:1362 start_codon:yes stop_codon:yes gene_type:complete
LNISIQNKGYLIKEFLVFFLLAFITRISYVYLQNPVPEKLIEDELLYWNASLLYLEKGYLENSLLAERMLGVFIYVKTLLVLSFKNLKLYLSLQSILDALTCIIIYKTGSLIIPKQKIYLFFSAAFSPLMIILSSQVLSETIFLFFFTIFLYFSIKITLLQKYLFFNIAIAGLFLGLSCSIRTITYPLVFLSIVPLIIILIKKNVIKLKIFIASIIFLLFSLLPISSRINDNLKLHDSFSLTSQAGIHLAYWVAPMIISETKNINRKDAIKLINEIAKKYTLTGDYYDDDKIFRKIGLEALSNISKINIAYHWVKAMLINLAAPSILIDKNLRSLPHPSFYETGKVSLWVKLLFSNKEYFNYLLIISLASITCLFTLISLILGPIYFYKNHKIIFYLSILYILYFSIITGPVLSPKYIFPILPCIFLYQAITFCKIVNFLKPFIVKNIKHNSN